MVIKDGDPRSLEYIAKHDTIDQDRAESYFKSHEFNFKYTKMEYLAHVSRIVYLDALHEDNRNSEKALQLYQTALEGFDLLNELDSGLVSGAVAHHREICEESIDYIKKQLVRDPQDDSTIS